MKYIVVLTVVAAISVWQAPFPLPAQTPASQTQLGMPPVRDWVILTDDAAPPDVFGCDQVSIRNGTDLSDGLVTGEYSQSPYQIGAAHDGHFIMALDQGHSGNAHVLVGNPLRRDQWKTVFYHGDFTWGADVDVTFDGRYALFGYAGGLAKVSVDSLAKPVLTNAAMNRLRFLPRSPVGWTKITHPLPPLDGFLPNASPASIVLAPDNRRAYVVTSTAKIVTVDIDSMQILGNPIAFVAPNTAPRARNYKTFATLSPSGRFLLVSSSLTAQVNLVDLLQSSSRLIRVPGSGMVASIRFNYQSPFDTLIAAHRGSSVSLLRFKDSAPDALELLSTVFVPAKSIELCIAERQRCADQWPYPALAWSGDGDSIIAAVGPVSYDWASIPLEIDSGLALGRPSFFKSCELPDNRRMFSTPNDIFTFNLIPTYTPIPSDTPTPTSTPSVTTTPSATATASPTPPRSSTPTGTPSPTSTPRPSATPTPSPLYLPLLLRERCLPEQRRVDVALVLDASLSMLEPAGDAGLPGPARSKLDAARGAALAFLDALHLDADRGDQAAVIGFNSSATLLSPLTADRPALDAALAAIAPAAQTCIVCGVDAAAAELASARHRADHAAVLILLTDGRSNPQPAAEAVARAALAKTAGIRVYTVGLGADLDEAALREMASGPEAYRHAPSAAELASIYRGIAVDIPCPAAAFWRGR